MANDPKPEDHPTGGGTEEEIDPFLKAAFQPYPMETPNMGGSVFEILKARSGLKKRIKLRDSQDFATGDPDPKADGSTLFPEDSGRYRVLDEIARGGLGKVLRILDTDLGRDVAMKLLQDRYAFNPEMIRRLIEEAQIGGQLQHPGIVPVYDIGLRADKRPYFTMKLVRGETLASKLRARQDPGEDRMRYLRIFEQICQTMAYAHSRGVIHRDLKPSNIMVGPFGEVQLMDWGLAKVLGQEGNGGNEQTIDQGVGEDPVETIRTGSTSHQSTAGVVMGTYAYMAPEQARGEIDRLVERTDVFGLGAILCEMLTGLPPFHGEDQGEVKQHVREGFLDPCWDRIGSCGADEDMKDLTKRCLAADPADRPADAGVVAEEMEAFLIAVDERIRRSELDAAEARVRAEESETRAVHERRARRISMTLSVIILLAMIVGGGGYAWFRDTQRMRMQRTTDRVNIVLAQAELLREDARKSGLHDLDAWSRVLLKVQPAEDLLIPGEMHPNARERLESFLVTIKQEVALSAEAYEQIEKDRVMIVRLENIRTTTGEQWNWEDMREAFVSAFKEYGIDIENLNPGVAAELIRESDIARELVTGLEGLIWACKETGFDRENLIEIAHLSEPDSWRHKLLHPIDKGSDPRQVREQIFSMDPAEIAPADVYDVVGALIRVGDHEGAAEYLARALDVYPNDFWINFKLAGLLCETLKPPRVKEGIGRYRAALAARPLSHAAWCDLGLALIHDGKIEQARRAFKRALELNPEDHITRRSYGMFLYVLDQNYGEAVQQLELALAIMPGDGGTLAALGTAYFWNGEYRKALDAFNQTLEQNPEHVGVRNNKAKTLMVLNDLKGALALLNETIRSHPSEVSIHMNRGMILEELGRQEEAIEAYRQGVMLAPFQAATHLVFGSALYHHGRFKEAVRHINKGIELGGYENSDCVAWIYEHEAYLYLGCSYWELGQPGMAKKFLQSALDIDPDLCHVRLLLGKVLHEGGDLNEASRQFETLLEHNWGDWKAWLNIGKVRLDQKISDQALACFEEVNNIHENAEAYVQIGLLHIANEDTDCAIEAFRDALRIDPEHFPAQSNLVMAYRLNRQYEKALQSAQTAFTIAPSYRKWEALHMIGDIQARSGRLREAEQAFREAMSADPSAVDPQFELGTLLRDLGRHEEAVEVFNSIIEVSPNHADAFMMLAASLQSLGRLYESLAAMQRSYKPDEKHPRSSLTTGERLDTCKRLIELSAWLPEFLEGKGTLVDPKDNILLALVCEAKGYSVAAARFFQKALSVRPELGNDVMKAYWFRAACVAALAGMGEGYDRSELSEQEKAMWRRMALTWLKKDLEVLNEASGKEVSENLTIARILAVRKLHPDLQAVRDPQALVSLPDDERNAWDAFWSTVDTILKPSQ